MEEQCSPLSWSYYYQEEGFEELKHSLLYSTLELEAAVVSAHEELSRKDEEILHLKDILAKIIKERDEFQAKLYTLELEKQLLFKQVQVQSESSSKMHKECPLSTSIFNEDENIELSPSDSDENIVVQSPPPPLLPPSLLDETDKISIQKPLPENGKFLQAVMEAGPLLQTLLLAGPLPQWQHPPPQLNSVDIPPVTISSPKPIVLPQDSCVFTPSSTSGGFIHNRAMAKGSELSPNSKFQKVVHQSSLIQHLVSP